MTWLQLLIVAVIQGAAELLPVSSSAHVILAEKLMGLDPTAPDMTFLLVTLHTGTMFAVLFYFWPRWKRYLAAPAFFKLAIAATVLTGVVGFALKKLIENVYGEVEGLFGNMPLVAVNLFLAGVIIVTAGRHDKGDGRGELNQKDTFIIGLVQSLCLPLRGFSRSGATISTALIRGVSRSVAEDFSFLLALFLTPGVLGLELRRLMKSTLASPPSITHGLVGMVLSFAAGLLALRWLSSWLERGRWAYFGYYCLVASAAVWVAYFAGV